MSGAKILLIDIETSPMEVFQFSLRDMHAGIGQIKRDPHIMGFAAQWYGSGKGVQWFSEYHHDREVMLKKAFDFLDEADIIIHYNGLGFDVPWINGELVREGFLPPSPFKNIDLYRVGKKNFRFASHKLAYVLRHLGLTEKLDPGGMDLWIKCLYGTPAEQKRAWTKMRRYCKRDVGALGPLYVKWMPWIANHPNLALYAGPEGDRVSSCPNCGGTHLQSRGWAVTTTRRYPRFQCQDCGAWPRGTGSDREATVDLTGGVR
jgi:hypothetical protein